MAKSSTMAIMVVIVFVEGVAIIKSEACSKVRIAIW